MIVLYGRPYDAKRLSDMTVLEYEGRRVSHDDEEHVVSLDVGVSCLDKATVFHACYHFKLRVYVAIEKASKKLIKGDKSLKVRCDFRMSLCVLVTSTAQRDKGYLRHKKALLTDQFVRHHFGVLQGLLERAEAVLTK